MNEQIVIETVELKNAKQKYWYADEELKTANIDAKVYEPVLEKQSDQNWLTQTALSQPPSLNKTSTKNTRIYCHEARGLLFVKVYFGWNLF